MTTLYDLKEEYLGLIEALENEEIDKAQAFELIQKARGDIKDKAKNIGFVVKNTSASIQVVDAEIKRLQDKKASLVKREGRLKDYLLYVMSELNIQGFKDDVMPIRRQVNSQCSVIIDDESLIPECYKLTETVVKIDKKAIAKDFESTPIEGVTVVKGEHVRVG